MIYTLSLHDALPTSSCWPSSGVPAAGAAGCRTSTSAPARSEEHTSELPSRENFVCRLLLEKKKELRDLGAHVAPHELRLAVHQHRGQNARSLLFFFFFNDTATTEIYTLSLHGALPI